MHFIDDRRLALIQYVQSKCENDSCFCARYGNVIGYPEKNIMHIYTSYIFDIRDQLPCQSVQDVDVVGNKTIILL